MNSPRIHSLLFFVLLILLSNCAEIMVGSNTASISQKKKVYCRMISYHFLDNDMETFKSFTQDFTAIRVEAFRNKVAYKLADNCEEKLTNQQLGELSGLIENPQGHEQEIQSLEHKYIEFFTPQKDIVLKFLTQVKASSDLEIEKEIQKSHASRKQIQEQTIIMVNGFRSLQNHINATGHHIFNTLNQFYSSMYDLHGNVTKGFQKFSASLEKDVENMKLGLSENVEKIMAHPHVKLVKDAWDGLWEEL